jgi:very-short-patch-repair endonuclease
VYQDSKVRVAEIAGRQWGRVKWAQLTEIGLAKRTIALWITQGYLHRRLPGVYAVGHAATSTEADFAEALLYAGPGAMLSHATAAWWLGLADAPPRQIHLSTPRQCRSQRGIVVHRRRALERVWHERMPITTIPQTLLDVAATEPLRTVRRALAKADYAKLLDAAAIDAVLGYGRPGAGTLRKALCEHQPSLARTNSGLEVLFVEVCERARFRIPEINVYVAGWQVDALWRAERIAVELDGYGNHHSPAQLKRDRRKELALRTAGYTPVRYSEEQLTRRPKEVIADLRRLGAPEA